jgi:uncharacterized OB-fold protein
MAETVRTLPVADELSERFWEGTAEGHFLVQRCQGTGRHQWYPRAHSIHDFHAAVDWIEATGRGRLYSFSVVYQTHTDIKTPYVLAIIELEEGVHVSGNIVDVPIEEIEIGMPLEVTFEPLAEGIMLPQFTRSLR